MPVVHTPGSDRPDVDPHPLSPYVAWAGHRNREPILGALRRLLPSRGEALEIASGSGMHLGYFAPHFPDVRFQPSDYDRRVFDTIKENRRKANATNISDPIAIDLTKPETWAEIPARTFDVAFVINIFQVAPLSIADGIAALSARVLKDDGLLAIYGPFKLDGAFTTPSNKAFHEELAATGVPEWGLKDVAELERVAKPHGLVLRERIDMPANNFTLVFRRRA